MALRMHVQKAHARWAVFFSIGGQLRGTIDQQNNVTSSEEPPAQRTRPTLAHKRVLWN